MSKKEPLKSLNDKARLAVAIGMFPRQYKYKEPDGSIFVIDEIFISVSGTQYVSYNRIYKNNDVHPGQTFHTTTTLKQIAALIEEC